MVITAGTKVWIWVRGSGKTQHDQRAGMAGIATIQVNCVESGRCQM